MKKLIVCLLMSTVILAIASSAEDAASLDGWISDMKCGAKNTSSGHAECVKQCLAAGEEPALVTDSDRKVLRVENPEAIKGHEGRHVTVTGHVDADKGSIHVASVEMLSDK